MGGEPLTIHALRRHNHEELSATLFSSLILHIYYSINLQLFQNLIYEKFSAPIQIPNLLLYHKIVAVSNFENAPESLQLIQFVAAIKFAAGAAGLQLLYKI